MAPETWRRWRDAMHDALYGPAGFYLRSGAPPANFRTAAHVGGAWARAIHALATNVDEQLGRPAHFTVTDVGAGAGELLAELASVAPDRWRLIGVDLAPRPAGLPARVDWHSSVPRKSTGLLTAVELLDVVPVNVVELTACGPRYVEVDRAGNERIGAAADNPDLGWLATWWPLVDVGDRAEIGSSRDEVWHEICTSLEAGAALLVDYAVDRSRDAAGTLTGYREGRQCPPVPDGSVDLTSDVAFDSLTTSSDLVLTQREALLRLGLRTHRTAYDGSPSAHLEQLSAAGDVAELLDPDGLGGFTWLLRGVGCDATALLESQ